MHRRTFVLAAASVLAQGCVHSRHSDRPPAAEAAMAPLASAGFTGSALVACGGEVLFSRDYGLEPHAGRTPSYWIASMSKQFTACAILILREAGRLRLEDSVSHYFPAAPADKAAITLFQLLTHQSGLKETYAADGIQDRDAAAQAILAVPLGAAPGSSYAYCNENYELLAMITEMVSERSFESFIKSELFDRARLQDVGFWPDETSSFVPPLLALPAEANRVANWGFRGSTGMRCSVPDLHRWAMALESDLILSAESRSLLFSQHAVRSDGVGVGFGWFRERTDDGRTLLWTRGYEDFGANAVLYRIVDSPLIIAAATNAGPREQDGVGWSRRARDALLAAYPGASPCR